MMNTRLQGTICRTNAAVSMMGMEEGRRWRNCRGCEAYLLSNMQMVQHVVLLACTALQQDSIAESKSHKIMLCHNAEQEGTRLFEIVMRM